MIHPTIAQASHHDAARASRASVVGLLAQNPLVAASGLLADSQSAVFMPWRDVRKVTNFPGWKVITLSNRWRPVLRLYCVDEPTFERARAVVASHTGPDHR